MAQSGNKVGVILSAGGSSFIEAARIAGSIIDPFVITDRPCAAELACEEASIAWERVLFGDKIQFSIECRRKFQERQIEFILLLFSRLVGAELYESMVCLNVHPSALPKFPGIGAVKRAFEAHSSVLGATLHVVDETVDGGPIVNQIVTPVPVGANLQWFHRASFLQKTMMVLVGFEFVLGLRQLSDINPAPNLRHDKFRDGYFNLQSNVGMGA